MQLNYLHKKALTLFLVLIFLILLCSGYTVLLFIICMLLLTWPIEILFSSIRISSGVFLASKENHRLTFFCNGIWTVSSLEPLFLVQTIWVQANLLLWFWFKHAHMLGSLNNQINSRYARALGRQVGLTFLLVQLGVKAIGPWIKYFFLKFQYCI